MKARERISRILEDRVLLLDGAYGTEFMKRASIGDRPPEILNIEFPEIVENLHRDYVEAGADILITNTFGATPTKLEKSGRKDKFEEIVRNAVRLARRVSKGKTLIFGDVGPTGELAFPMGEKNFSFFYENFRSQVEIMVEEGVDGIILETFSDIAELKAAVLAVRDVSKDIFLIAHLTFDENGRTLTGTDPMNFALVFEDLDVDALGINCTLGPEELLPIFQELAKYTRKFLTVEPNAGMPFVKNGKTVYPVGPEEFSIHLDSYWKSGANILGGCCGTTPEHIREMRVKLGKRRPISRDIKKMFVISSPSKVVTFENFVIVGERINPAGRKKMSKAMEEGDLEYVLNEGKKQVKAGAEVLDVNFGIEKFVDRDFMEKVVYSLSYGVGAPLFLDVQTIPILRELVKSYPGRPVINSFRPVEEEIEKIEIVKNYGGVLILLAMGESVPEGLEDRMKAFEKGVKILENFGLGKDRIIVDPVVLAMGAGGEPLKTLEFLKYVSDLGYRTTLGLSNLSFGLLNRSFYNSSFLVLAIDRGLSSAIVNPLDEIVMKSAKAARIVLGMEELLEKKEKKTRKRMSS